MSGRVATLGWVASRIVVLLLLFGYEAAHGVGSDLAYFATGLRTVPQHGLAHTLVEYPLPAVAVLAVPMLIARVAGDTGLYGSMFVLCAMAVDAAFMAVLFHAGTAPRRRGPLVVWLLAGPLLGGIILARFDLLVGVLVGVVVLVAARRPSWSAALVAVATSLKLWPVLLVPALVAASRRRLSTVAVVAGVGMAFVVAIVATAGLERLLSPLTYQSDRGLQIESVAATPAMIAWAADGRPWHVHFARSHSFEVTGPGTTSLDALSTVLALLLLLVLATVWLRAFRRQGAITPEALVWISLAGVTAFIVSSKVLSPQYLMWLVPVATVGLSMSAVRRLWTWTATLLVVCALTHLVYPWTYHGLVRHNDLTPVALCALVVRNVGLVVLLVLAMRNAWRSISPGADGERSQPLLSSSPSTARRPLN